MNKGKHSVTNANHRRRNVEVLQNRLSSLPYFKIASNIENIRTVCPVVTTILTSQVSCAVARRYTTCTADSGLLADKKGSDNEMRLANAFQENSYNPGGEMLLLT